MDEKVRRIKALYEQVRECEKEHREDAAHKIGDQVDTLVAEVLKGAPGSEHAIEALQYQKYVLLSLGRVTVLYDWAKQFTDRAYESGAKAIRLLQKRPPSYDLAHGAYNQGIDFVMKENRLEEGIRYLRLGRRISRKLPRLRGQAEVDLQTEYAIAYALKQLGQRDKAKRCLRRAMLQLKMKDYMDWFANMRPAGKCFELLAEIDLEEREERREKRTKS